MIFIYLENFQELFPIIKQMYKSPKLVIKEHFKDYY